MTLIARTDTTEDLTITMSGNFGEEPASYTFSKNTDAGGRFTAEIDDPKAVERLLSIPGYVEVGADGKAVKPGGRRPSPPAINRDPADIGEARRLYREVMGAPAGKNMTIADMVEKMRERNEASTPLENAPQEGGDETEIVGVNGEITPDPNAPGPDGKPKSMPQPNPLTDKVTAKAKD